jgi:hypothetical protein
VCVCGELTGSTGTLEVHDAVKPALVVALSELNQINMVPVEAVTVWVLAYEPDKPVIN